jgi:tetratricopeptide (TPR) repeat protein
MMAGCLLTSSCNGWLDVKPKGYTIPEKYNDYALLLNSSALQSALYIYPVYMTDDVLLANDGEGLSSFQFNGLSDSKRNMYTFQHGQVFTPGNSDPIWEDAYSRIFTFNAVINNVMATTDATELAKGKVKGEALVGRAFEYLNLVNCYANHYDKSTATTDYGVPLVLTEEVGSGSTYVRNTVEEVYAQIESDLTTAVPLLSDVVPNTYHPTKSIAYAFLARMYLYKGEYDKALTNANEALKINKELLDYTSYKTIDGTQFGRIVLAADENERLPDECKSVENIYTRKFWSSNNLFWKVCASKDLLSTYATDLPSQAEDMRLKLFFCDGKMDGGGGFEYFPGFQMYAPYITVCCGFSTPEILLIAAECEARVGSVDNALTLLNTLRDKRIKNNEHYTKTSDMTKDKVLKMVIDERRREFVFSGITRLIDLKRLNRESWFAKEIVHSANGETWTLPANDSRYIMPIPNNVLEYNPTIPQYER